MTQPATRPHHPVYPPPPPSGFTDPGGATPVEHALRVQQAVHSAYQAWRDAHSPQISPEVLRDNAGVFTYSDPALALAPALANVKAAADDAQAEVDDRVGAQKVDTADVAAQLAAERYWRRTERTLDSIKDGSKAVAAAQDLIKSASDDQIPVLAEELGPYLAARSLPTGWLVGALAARVPGLDEAQSAATLLARQHAVLAANHANLTRAMARDTSPAPLLDPYAANSTPYEGGAYRPGAVSD